MVRSHALEKACAEKTYRFCTPSSARLRTIPSGNCFARNIRGFLAIRARMRFGKKKSSSRRAVCVPQLTRNAMSPFRTCVHS